MQNVQITASAAMRLRVGAPVGCARHGRFLPFVSR